MHIMTADGNIVEGKELTAEEASIAGGLIGEDLNQNGVYLTSSERRHIANFLISTFHMARRKPVEPFIPFPPSPGVEYLSALAPALAELKAEEEAEAVNG